MGRKLVAMAVLAAGLLLVSRLAEVRAQEVKPGPEHQVMEPLVGKWHAKVAMWLEPGKPASEWEAGVVRKWIMNGLFVQEDFDGKFMGLDFKGMGMVGYDVQKKKYVGTWVDSMETSISFMEGTYDAKSKTFHMAFDETDPTTGKKAKIREVLRIMSNDHQKQEFFKTVEGGKEDKMMEINYHRVVKK